ncbi:RraA family protein [Evansella cellulosilytica]|uniref:Putative 4-hydroxy-4-methyl-2-oxoglutarate aldolase n=1 Tax=Evansella cellulosilytica (strain ATCC 21833 / DSM 2522 / FERM P-1141 / JCM 9156 / N-4) TaxID=649639 RepID=E6TTH1_EVAC2|nr:RraA family protein [Evansella cellulosilytica]ADU29607.1 Dimethylmenaquinone methyltransferase [Evansella cellulosilytica DSM 2522]
MENIGFQILPINRRPNKALIERYRHIATPLISDNMSRLQGTYSHIRPFHKSKKITGTAFTVRTRAGDNLMVHKAIDMAERGDVIVVDAGGDMTQAIIGEIMLRLAKKNGIEGFVIDGAIRDSAAFESHDYPCFAKGVTHRGPYKDGPGEINVPITVGNMIVHPGDIIVGDEDGVIAVPLDFAEELIELATEQETKELGMFEAIENETIDRSWVDETLRQKGCAFM